MTTPDPTTPRPPAANPAVATVAWLWVLVPFGYGVYELLIKLPALFSS